MLQYPQIDPVAIGLGPVQIHWYGITYLVGFVSGYLLARYRAQKAGSGWDPEEIGDLVFYIALGVILGGRIGSILFYNFEQFLGDPLMLLRIWEGGMSFHGGLIGVIAAFFLYARNTKRTFFQVSDFLAPMFPIGLGAGRIGNFINGELWGRPTDVPWGMVFAHVDQQARHPNQLYQFAFEGIVLFILMWWFSSKQRPRMAVSGFFLLLYGIYRFAIEFVREPDSHLGFVAFDWLTMGQVLSVPMVLLGVGLMLAGYKLYGNPKAVSAESGSSASVAAADVTASLKSSQTGKKSRKKSSRKK